MAMQLAPGGQDAYGSQYGGRPQSQHYGGEGTYGTDNLASRTRSQSVGTQRQYTKDGRPILHYCKYQPLMLPAHNSMLTESAARAMYLYQAAIPEELSFVKGDILAVTRHQDDGWWEAEVMGKNAPPGLVPSNYLKNC